MAKKSSKKKNNGNRGNSGGGDKVYKIIEIVGTSENVISDAIENAIAKAGETLQHLDWFEVVNIRGAIRNNRPLFQVTVKIGFRLDDSLMD